MFKTTVNLNRVDRLKNFVNEISKFNADFDAVRDKYVIDAKSIIGMFSLDLSKPIDIVVNFREENEVETILEMFRKYE